jgi:hypothetical protein
MDRATRNGEAAMTKNAPTEVVQAVAVARLH